MEGSREDHAVWEEYFKGRDYEPQCDAVSRKFEPLFDHCFAHGGAELNSTDGSLTLNFHQLEKLCDSQDRSIPITGAAVKEAIRTRPSDTLACMELAAHRVLSRRQPNLQLRVHVRIVDYPAKTKLKSLKANLIDNYFATKGTVVRVGNIRPMVTRMSFQCAKCGESVLRHFEGGKYNPPTSCPVDGCRSRTFAPDRDGCTTVDWQKIRLQEIVDDDREAGRIPRTVDVDLTNDLVDCCVPGDIVTVGGIVRSIKTEGDRGGGNQQAKALYFLFLEANSVVNTKKKGRDAGAYSQLDMQMIEQVSNDDSPLRLLVNSLCPSIFGQEMVKAGLVLCMLGGVGKYQSGEEKNRLAIRGDPHMLIVGDPGLGKSQMLRAAAMVHPRGVYVCGNTATGTGLTVTLVRDPQTGEHALEAGALVLADQGMCAIDEFDKISSDHSSLLEAMEQQSISMAKAGMICSLSARCSMVAAANPVGGHYDQAKTVCENIKMSAALLSRFDLTFILLDNPDERHDQELSEHVISMHSTSDKMGRDAPHVRKRRAPPAQSGGGFSQPSQRMRRDTVGFDDALPGAAGGGGDDDDGDGNALGLEATLQYSEQDLSGGGVDLLPHECFQKYVRYVRSNCRPVLSADARKVLQDFYLDLRQNYTSEDATPVTTRQLESLIRLTQARAKVDLRDVASGADARQVVELMKHSLRDVCLDAETGLLDFSRGHIQGGMSKKQECDKMYKKMSQLAKQKQDALFHELELDEVARKLGARCHPACPPASQPRQRTHVGTPTVWCARGLSHEQV
jgi:DNA helicase MCM8